MYFQPWNAIVWSWKLPHGQRGSHFVEKGILHYRVHLCVKSFSSNTPLKTTKHVIRGFWLVNRMRGRADGRTYADVITNFPRIDRFFIFFSRGGSASSLYYFILQNYKHLYRQLYRLTVNTNAYLARIHTPCPPHHHKTCFSNSHRLTKSILTLM